MGERAPRYLAISTSELEDAAVHAACDADLPALIGITDAFEQRWGHAVARQRRDRLDELIECLLNAVDRARASLTPSITEPVRTHLAAWEVMFRLGRVFLSMDTGRDALAELRHRQFQHGETLLSELARRPSARTSELAHALNLSSNSCSNVLSRLRDAEFVAEIGRGWYALTSKGSAVVAELAGVPWLDSMSRLLALVSEGRSPDEVCRLLVAEGVIPAAAAGAVAKQVVEPILGLRKTEAVNEPSSVVEIDTTSIGSENGNEPFVPMSESEDDFNISIYRLVDMNAGRQDARVT